jgi:hypothetical protein
MGNPLLIAAGVLTAPPVKHLKSRERPAGRNSNLFGDGVIFKGRE